MQTPRLGDPYLLSHSARSSLLLGPPADLTLTQLPLQGEQRAQAKISAVQWDLEVSCSGPLWEVTHNKHCGILSFLYDSLPSPQLEPGSH